MGPIHINRNRQSLGQFSDQEVADGLQSGRFRPDDLAWHATMDSWQPLSNFTNLPPALEEAPASSPQAPPMHQADTSSKAVPAWEGTEPKSLIAAAIETIRQILSSPATSFRFMSTTGGLSKPLKFYILVSWLTSTVALLYEFTSLLINPGALAEGGFKDFPQSGVFLIFIGLFLLLPVILFVRSFVVAGILHLALLLVGGAQKPFETTFRVLCYASGSTSVLQVIPICGPWVYLVTSLVYSVIGLKEAHRTELWRPILALFLIFLGCGAMLIGTVMLGVFAIGGSLAK